VPFWNVASVVGFGGYRVSQSATFS
jgi:hypothetical protein